MHCNCPKSQLCWHRRHMCLPTCLHQIVGCHLFRYRKLYDLYCISSTSRFKKKNRLTYWPRFSGQKGKQTFISSRPKYECVSSLGQSPCLDIGKDPGKWLNRKAWSPCIPSLSKCWYLKGLILAGKFNIYGDGKQNCVKWKWSGTRKGDLNFWWLIKHSCVLNGWQVAKMKKSIPDLSLP